MAIISCKWMFLFPQRNLCLGWLQKALVDRGLLLNSCSCEMRLHGSEMYLITLALKPILQFSTPVLFSSFSYFCLWYYQKLFIFIDNSFYILFTSLKNKLHICTKCYFVMASEFVLMADCLFFTLIVFNWFIFLMLSLGFAIRPAYVSSYYKYYLRIFVRLKQTFKKCFQ